MIFGKVVTIARRNKNRPLEVVVVGVWPISRPAHVRAAALERPACELDRVGSLCSSAT